MREYPDRQVVGSLFDFDKFDHNQFIKDLKNYFQKKLKFNELSVKMSGINKIIYLQFPILDKIGFPININKPTDAILFIRIDTSPIHGKGFLTEISLKSTYYFSFIIKRYSLSDMFAGKIAAILSREKWEGGKKQPRFKGRDYFDIFWFYSKGVKINISYLKSILNINLSEEIVKKIKERLHIANGKKAEIEQDLLPFFSEPEFVKNFIKNFEIFNSNFVLYLEKH